MCRSAATTWKEAIEQVTLVPFVDDYIAKVVIDLNIHIVISL